MHPFPAFATVVATSLLMACPGPPHTSDMREDADSRDVETELGDDTPDGDAEALSGDPDIEVTGPETVACSTLSCDDENPCTTDSCADGACRHTPNLVSCDDGDPCTELDRCSAGVCGGVAVDCDDGEACTQDLCGAAGCEHVAQTGPCDDGDLCTSGDQCDGGHCVGVAVTCPSGGVCQEAVCRRDTGCRLEPRQGACDDDNACTEGTECRSGACRGRLLDCDDGDPCTDDYCDPASGCAHRDNRAPCDDGDACTTGDRCQAGACVGAPRAMCCAAAADCDDGDACTVDRCEGGGCVHEALSCDDGERCTLDRCNAGACESAAWSVVGLEVGDDFEAGVDGWQRASSNAAVGWRSDATWAASGDRSLYCGAIASEGYDLGATRARASKVVRVPPEATLRYAYRVEVEDDGSCVFDVVEVWLDGVRVDRICATGEGTREVALGARGAALEGREVTLELVFDTVDGERNGGRGVWIDDLVLRAGVCR
ncbi:MAG: hypothetical protein JNJ59_03865 [Deltaproteobacteria bacterium]|nr:hypothetical protein [Deltaproteobacteria bacterium]